MRLELIFITISAHQYPKTKMLEQQQQQQQQG
jgi:hypothetical protein